jgi:hypothetical protein
MKTPVIIALFLLAATACSTTREVDFNGQMNQAISAKEKDFHACYQKFGAEKDVRTTVKYGLSSTGDVETAEVDPAKSANTNGELGACIVKEFRTIRVPAVKGYDGLSGVYAFKYNTR